MSELSGKDYVPDSACQEDYMDSPGSEKLGTAAQIYGHDSEGEIRCHEEGRNYCSEDRELLNGDIGTESGSSG